MATESEIETLELIKKLKKASKNKGGGLTKNLSGGKEKYRSALNTMISVGSLAAITSFIVLGKAVFDLSSFIANNWNVPIADYGALILYICEIGVFITTIFLGLNLATLEVTPTFALVSLIVILVANGLLAIGIFPLITVVLAVIGLIRWSTFKSWFYGLDKKRKNLVGKTSETKTIAKGINDTRNSSSIGWIVAFVITLVIAVGGSIGCYFLGKYQGNESGKREGFTDGYKEGEAYGRGVGESNGFTRGYNNGYQKGYDEGFEEMRAKAMCIVSGGRDC